MNLVLLSQEIGRLQEENDKLKARLKTLESQVHRMGEILPVLT